MITRRTTTLAQRAATVVVGVLIALPLTLAGLLADAAPAQASTYRYWTYWWGTGTGPSHTGWKFASQGPASHGLGDRWVLGWRFSTTSVTGGTSPRQSPSYDSLCPGRPAVAGSVRVALVIDYGTKSDAPPGETPPRSTSVRVECEVLSTSSNPSGSTVLREASPGVVVRSDNGLICALDGYPRSECAPVIADPAPTPTPSRTVPSPRPTPTSAPTHASTSGPVPSATPAGRPPTGTAATAAPSSPASGAAGGAAPAPTTSAGAAAAATASVSPSESYLPAAAGAAATTAAEGAASTPLGVLVGGLLVAALAGSAWWNARRRGGTT